MLNLAVQVRERRRRAVAGVAQMGAAELDGLCIGGPIGMIRAMAGGARLPAGGGQGCVVEDLLAEQRERAERGFAGSQQMNRVNVGAGEVRDEQSDTFRHALGVDERVGTACDQCDGDTGGGPQQRTARGAACGVGACGTVAWKRGEWSGVRA